VATVTPRRFCAKGRHSQAMLTRPFAGIAIQPLEEAGHTNQSKSGWCFATFSRKLLNRNKLLFDLNRILQANLRKHLFKRFRRALSCQSFDEKAFGL
jgi:hypothetical protein